MHQWTSAFELIKQYQQGQAQIDVTIESIIQSIEQKNIKLNAICEDRFEEARKEAKEKQIKLNQHEVDFNKYPLWGLPITIKESFAVKGMKQTLGTLERKNWIAHEDATLVKRLKELGAIILGTTNTSELCFWFECSNPVYGKTSNPLDLSRTSGGSSGGEAALIASEVLPIGLGSDIGGSIRIPAHFCGLIGYKASPGVLPMTGHFPAIEPYVNDWMKSQHMSQCGFLGHSLEDISSLTQLLSGSDQRDPQSLNCPSLNYEWTHAAPKIYVLADPDFAGAYKADHEVVQATQNAARYLDAMGYDVVHLKTNAFEFTLFDWLYRAQLEKVDSFANLISPLQGFSPIRQILAEIKQSGRIELPGLVTSIIEHYGAKFFHSNREQDWLINKQKIHALLGQEAVILLPTHPRVAMKHGTSITRPFDFIYTGFANAYDLPATQITVAKSSQTQMPIGCQILAHPYQDHLTWKVADELLRGFNQ